MKGYHYLPKFPSGTKQAIKSFDRIFHKLHNRVVRITGTFDNKSWYRVKFYTEDGQVYDFKGFAWWYGGEGPRGLAVCLRKLGICESIIEKLTDHSCKLQGDTYNPNSFFINIERNQLEEVSA
ncbi:hypothetical protein [Paenibacillus hexagrammi]|uniref:Uncharacterized protein n=1 Tax=Paenibacillus hexagrammi TaxID=2908839 RepID=A0ABY3SRQ7_9BACL|nr:hypothetical protein [Paenibacillus sp. YPD9-1]UJF36557.1 hypothetical protein L0M14_30685 [Paenibacillus sp. YPD9-1]